MSEGIPKLRNENHICWIFGLFFENAYKWKPHHWKDQVYVLNTYYNIDTNDLAAMEPARKAITHHAWHVMTFFFHTSAKVIYPKYNQNWLHTLAYTIDCVCFNLFWPQNVYFLVKIFSTFLKAKSAPHQKSMRFIWVFIVLGIYNFALASNHRQSCYTKIGAPTLKISSTESLRIFR